MINNDEILFEWYKGQLGKYINSDNREINIQNRIIIPFLEKIFMGEEIEIVDTSTLYKNWNKRVGHDRTKYGGQYTPDILLASSNWDIYNENKNIDYYALFEVKVPTTSKGERTHAINECTDYLKHVNKVVLTNGISWEFFDKSGSGELISLEENDMYVCKRGEDKIINWKQGIDGQIIPDEWGKLISRIKSLVGKDKNAKTDISK